MAESEEDDPPTFIASPSFKGPKQGYVFTSRPPFGTGYHLDTPASRSSSVEVAAEEEGTGFGVSAQTVPKAPSAPMSPMSKMSKMSGFDVRRHLEASLRFRLAWLLDHDAANMQANAQSETGARVQNEEDWAEARAEAWREYASANALVAQLADAADAAAVANAQRASSSTAQGPQAAAAASPNPVGVSAAAALAQTAALRLAFCRDCVHSQIPSAEAWRSPKKAVALPPVPTSKESGPALEVSKVAVNVESSYFRPVFVVGMPRSGTTLIESMLGNHRWIAACGEVPSLAVMAPQIYVERDPATKELTKATFDPAVTSRDMDAIAARFMRALKHHADTEDSADRTSNADAGDVLSYGSSPSLLVSKLPNHFELLGFIAKLFPGAKVIHATRDVRDTLLSNYQMHYQQGHRWSYNLTQGAEAFAGYRAIMRHWTEDVFKEPPPPPVASHLASQLASKLDMLEVRYEDLVCDPQGAAKAMASFLEVPYDPNMATPHTNKRAAHTSSNEQVRRKVYTSSVGRWRTHQGTPRAKTEEAAAAEKTPVDLDALGLELGGFPAEAVLERVLSFEPPDARATHSLSDLARDLPCAPRDSDNDPGHQEMGWRWPGGNAGSFQRA